MATISTGVFKKLVFKKQSAQGTLAGASGAQYMRRVTSTIDLNKAQYKSAEIRSSQQRADSRHGVRSVEGSISGELSVGGYQPFMESVLRQAAQTASTTGAQITIAAAPGTGAAGNFNWTGGTFLTNGFKVGDVVSATGFASPATANNSHYAVVTALTNTAMTVLFLDGVAMVTRATGDSVTIVTVGKKTWIPQSSHTRDYYTIEHFYGDIGQSEYFQDCVVSGMNLKLPATGIATVDFPIMGLNMLTGSSAYFTTPTAAPTGGLLTAVNGAIFVDGAKVGTITSLDISITGNYSAPGGVVGSNFDPDIFPGVVEVTGSMSVLFDSITLRDLFVNENAFSIFAVFTTGSTPNAPFLSIVMPNVKAGGASKDDGEKGLTMTMPFIASEKTDGGAAVANLQTTISIQDSAFV